MNIVIDMNLSPDWVKALSERGVKATHWSEIGDPGTSDAIIFDWARKNGYFVFTHDLDFGTILAATKTVSPSVIQIRTQDPSPSRCKEWAIAAILKHSAELEHGALITLDEKRARLTMLPLRKADE